MWEQQSGIPVDVELKKSVFKKKGWFNGYKAHFNDSLSIDFASGPANLGMLEELVLARNRIEHPSVISNHRTNYTDLDLEKRPHPFFVDEREAALFADINNGEISWLIPPTLHITADKLLTSIAEVDIFAEWFDEKIEECIYPLRA